MYTARIYKVVGDSTSSLLNSLLCVTFLAIFVSY